MCYLTLASCHFNFRLLFTNIFWIKRCCFLLHQCVIGYCTGNWTGIRFPANLFISGYIENTDSGIVIGAGNSTEMMNYVCQYPGIFPQVILFSNISAPSSTGGGIIKRRVLSLCPSVRLSVACLDLTQEGSPKLARRKPITRVPVNLFRGQKVKGQGHQDD